MLFCGCCSDLLQARDNRHAAHPFGALRRCAALVGGLAAAAAAVFVVARCWCRLRCRAPHTRACADAALRWRALPGAMLECACRPLRTVHLRCCLPWRPARSGCCCRWAHAGGAREARSAAARVGHTQKGTRTRSSPPQLRRRLLRRARGTRTHLTGSAFLRAALRAVLIRTALTRAAAATTIAVPLAHARICDAHAARACASSRRARTAASRACATRLTRLRSAGTCSNRPCGDEQPPASHQVSTFCAAPRPSPLEYPIPQQPWWSPLRRMMAATSAHSQRRPA
jgi:hypothetical protein